MDTKLGSFPFQFGLNDINRGCSKPQTHNMGRFLELPRYRSSPNVIVLHALGELFVEPEYDSTTEEVYRNLAIKAINSGSLVQILSNVQHGPEVPMNLTSWIPRWDTVYTSILFPGYSASSFPVLPQKYILKPGDIISVQGRQVSTVREVISITLPEDNGKVLKDQITLSFILTAGRDWLGIGVQNDESHLNHFAAFAKKHEPNFAQYIKTPSNLDLEESYKFEIAATSACTGRVLLFDDQGQLILGPAATRPGDRVAILHGGDILFVLRPIDGHFLLVGECYLYDYMKSQVEWQRKTGELADQWFEIH